MAPRINPKKMDTLFVELTKGCPFMFQKSESITMRLGGIHSAVDRRQAESVLKQVKGVRSASVNQNAVAAVTYRADQTNVDTITSALASIGYPVI